MITFKFAFLFYITCVTLIQNLNLFSHKIKLAS